jgi:hypothetical protein
MKKSLMLAAIAATVAAAGTANGQSLQTGQATAPPTYLTGRAGYVFPIDTNLRDVSSGFFGLGVDYTFARGLIGGGETFFSADWLGKTSGGGRLNIFPFCINERFFLNNGTGGTAAGTPYSRAYVFAGLGAFLFDMDPSTFRFGGRAGIGAEFNKNFVAEAALYLSSPTSGTNIHANAVGLYIGYRFSGGY